MREAALIKRLLVTASGAALFIFLVGCSVEAGGDSAAHALAERFAKEANKGGAQPGKRAEEQKRPADETVRQTSDERRKADEAEMLARAREEAEQRRAEIMKAREEAERAEQQRKDEEARRLADASRKADEERRAAEVKKVAEQAKAAEEERKLAESRRRSAEAARKAEEEHRIVEARRAEEQARAAEEARWLAESRRKAEEEAKAEEVRRAAEAGRKAEEERRIAETRRAEERAKIDAESRIAAEEARRARLEAEREAEGQRLADRLREARERRESRTAEKRPAGLSPSAESEQGSAEPRQEVGRTTSAHASGPEPRGELARADRVTVLLILEPGNYGIRRHNKTADPILCSLDGCYVSNGADEAASFLAGRRALKFGRIFGERAGACSNSLGCVFRDIELRSIARSLSPVDLHVLKHDRRQAQQDISPSDCRIEGPRISCRRGIRTADYMMWVIPESLAERAGSEALEEAVVEGLPERERVGSLPHR